MKTRKTVDVATVLTKANRVLANPDVSDDFRRGVASLLETILFETGNYQGFNYRGWLNGGYEAWRIERDRLAEPNLSTAPYLGNETLRFYYSRQGAKEES